MIENYIPQISSKYILTETYSTLKSIVLSDVFLPTLLTGPTGIGKTQTIIQLHANLKKPILRVPITIEVDEDRLMGGFRLKDGKTYFSKGPVINAMEFGMTLLLDEIDLGNSTKIMCLQSVLENEGYFIQKTGEYVKPKPGFKIIATGNTKGIGDQTGLYVGTQFLNNAMLDRFSLVIEENYPTYETELCIIKKLAEEEGISIKYEVLENLLSWARETRSENVETLSLEYSISTRRLCDIIKTYKIFPNIQKAIKMSINRFDDAHQTAFYNLYLAKFDQQKSNDTFDEDTLKEY